MRKCPPLKKWVWSFLSERLWNLRGNGGLRMQKWTSGCADCSFQEGTVFVAYHCYSADNHVPEITPFAFQSDTSRVRCVTWNRWPRNTRVRAESPQAPTDSLSHSFIPPTDSLTIFLSNASTNTGGYFSQTSNTLSWVWLPAIQSRIDRLIMNDFCVIVK
jgi:hypothetical protein